jgi:nicotinate-nucleotide--dimethylbenzimidazole phosphoribosyltransferase
VCTPRKLFLPVFGADHGVTTEGVSAFPAALTGPILANVVHGGAGVSVMARELDVQIRAIDVGIATDFASFVKPEKATIEVIFAKIASGTQNICTTDAMTESEFDAALDVGLSQASQAHDDGVELAGVGEVGIGNTTSAAALICAFTSTAPKLVVGRGTGINDAALARKISVVERSLARLAANLATDNVLDGTSRARKIGYSLGGFELVAMAGFMLGAAQHRIPIVLDGFLAAAAALIANGLDPAVRGYLVASHRSDEPGMRAAMDHLQLNPLFDLGMRLGEGTGALLGMKLVQTSVMIANEMATFASAGLL